MDRSILIKKYFEEQKFVASNIQSFNSFLDNGLQEVIEENKEAEPTIIPHNIEKFKIRFGRITIGKPEITEADGSKRPIYPMEARLRKISYHAPIYLEVSTYINDVQRENFVAQVGKMPIMLKSKFCNLEGLSKEDLVKRGEDPSDPGGYFEIPSLPAVPKDSGIISRTGGADGKSRRDIAGAGEGQPVAGC